MLVSIIIPRLPNRRNDWLKETLKSVEQQSYKNIELIIEENNKSEAENIQNGFNKSTGNIIHILHDDDTLTPNAVELAVQYIQNHDFIHGDAYEMETDHTNDDLGLSRKYTLYSPTIKIPTLNQLKETNYLHFATMYYTREAFLSACPFITDYILSLKLLKSNRKLNYCPHPLAYYRIHPDQISQSTQWKQTMKERKQIALNSI